MCIYLEVVSNFYKELIQILTDFHLNHENCLIFIFVPELIY